MDMAEAWKWTYVQENLGGMWILFSATTGCLFWQKLTGILLPCNKILDGAKVLSMKWSHESIWNDLKNNLGGGKAFLSGASTNNLDYEELELTAKHQ